MRYFENKLWIEKMIALIIFLCPAAIYAEGIDYNLRLHMEASSGETGFMSSVDSIKEALLEGADINYKLDWLGNQTPLMAAAKEGHTEIVRLLLSKGAAINMVDDSGKTALMFAAAKGHSKAVEILLSNNANMKAVDEYGKTAISLASKHGYDEIVNMLKQERENIVRENLIQGVGFIDGIFEPYRMVYVAFNKNLSFRRYFDNVVSPALSRWPIEDFHDKKLTFLAIRIALLNNPSQSYYLMESSVCSAKFFSVLWTKALSPS